MFRMTERPLVTLGMPVRNGAAMIRAALDSMVQQDYPNLEIVVSDNASDDETPAILRDYSNRYNFIRTFRQQKPIPVFENFMFVLGQARGDFFAWCAHDDTRSLNFVSGLLPAFSDSQTSLAFGDTYLWDGKNPASLHSDYNFATDGLPRWLRLRKAALMQCFDMYGLWRIDALRKLRVRHARWWPDLPVMTGAAVDGEFRYVAGVTLRYFEIPKTTAQRAHYEQYTAGASLIGNLFDVSRGCFITVSRDAGLPYGLLTLVFVIERFLRQVPQSCKRRLLKARQRRTA
jgi:Glycosyl transferase family 2